MADGRLQYVDRLRLQPPSCSVKQITVYCRDHYVLTAYSRAPTLGWVRDGPCCVLPLSSSDQALGEAIVETIRHSGTTRDPNGAADWAEVLRPLLAAAKVRSWNQFVKRNRAIGVFLDREYRLVPTENREPRAGFGDLDDRSILLPADASTAEFGAAAKEAFKRSK